jgi:hypothetical protein
VWSNGKLVPHLYTSDELKYSPSTTLADMPSWLQFGEFKETEDVNKIFVWETSWTKTTLKPKKD